MPEYEKNCLAEYVSGSVEGRFIFAETTDEKLIELIARLVHLDCNSEKLCFAFGVCVSLLHAGM